MTKKAIRVPETTWGLVVILDEIFRNHMRLDVFGNPCMTFKHHVNWDIYPKTKHLNLNPEWDQDWNQPEHEMSVYFGSGYVNAFGFDPEPGNAQKVQMRIRAEYSTWVNASVNYWEFQIWMKTSTGEMLRYCYTCDLGYGDSRYILDNPKRRMPKNPPNMIAFWKAEPAKED